MQAAEVGPVEAGDMALVRRALARDPDAFRAIIKTHNQRLYRIARGVVRNDAEAEDVLQETYMRAFSSLGAFRGEASLSTWLSRIAINEALGRLRKRKRIVAMPGNPEAQIIRFPLNQNDVNPGDDPERTMAQRQILGLVERATDSLPDVYRTVFVARVIEGLSIEETADLLGVKPETVKTRLHRARALVRKALDDEIGPVLLDAFPFAGRRCERLTQAVMRRLGFEP
ncbi:RNA polymerase subunit sigma [Mesorhizobium sp. LCM 4577]|jgi:RNA polymerase sigma-70 factor (ECF subfamily)|uniref:RNA polymerase sigma factor n=2 Tax=Mesorhizobium TaxID=68287 RepID=A0A090GW61_MESPL|nr:RNA polymerase subunit sigma [Mesorhizobium sp. LCM 4576]OHV65515.1 RNA polymerase subunit sigma [Mesorhizobium sp. LCM 4577]CDX27926.1 RNA polymerase sigma factor [Mesorhizobium plurifarium]CDX62452.1 RNA polymerase sigma factor [Mesorhizobium plurifarium]